MSKIYGIPVTSPLNPGVIDGTGANGKSAYELALENGFVGTLDEWLESLVGPPCPIDPTLSVEGQAADAKATGEAIYAHTLRADNPHGVTAAQVGATPSSHATNKSNPHGVTIAQAGGTNPNILDDWYLANPINQRGATEYTAAGFCIDRWSFEQWQASGKSVELRSGCVAIVSGASASTNNTTKLKQTIVDPQRLAGKTVTFSAKLKNVTVNGAPRLTIYYGGSKKDMNITSAHANSIISVTATLPTNLSSMYVAIGNDANAAGKGGFDIEIESVKLEVGAVSTLANDAPPNYSEELLKCQRFYVRFAGAGGQFLVGATTGTTVYATLCLPTAMYDGAGPTVGYANANIYPFISGGSVEVTSVGGYFGCNNRQTCIITASHATNTNLPAKTPATIRLTADGYIDISCEI